MIESREAYESRESSGTPRDLRSSAFERSIVPRYPETYQSSECRERNGFARRTKKREKKINRVTHRWKQSEHGVLNIRSGDFVLGRFVDFSRSAGGGHRLLHHSVRRRHSLEKFRRKFR